MTAQELILLNKAKVRRDSNLMHLYLRYFHEAYGYRPSCAGCSFSTDWEKIVKYYSKNELKNVILEKQNFMAITIKKIQGKILSYKKDGKTYRLYDNLLTSEFIDEYLKNGNKEELSERKKLFNFPLIEVDNNKLVAGITESEFVEIITHKKRGRKPRG